MQGDEVMDKALLMFMGFWVVWTLYFFIKDVVEGFRKAKNMAGIGNGIYTVATNSTTTTTMSTNPTGTKTTFNGRVHMQEGAVVEDMDVGEGLRLLTFFLQSRHPEVFEEYQAIRKIEKS